MQEREDKGFSSVSLNYYRCNNGHSWLSEFASQPGLEYENLDWCPMCDTGDLISPVEISSELLMAMRQAAYATLH